MKDIALICSRKRKKIQLGNRDLRKGEWGVQAKKKKKHLMHANPPYFVLLLLGVSQPHRQADHQQANVTKCLFVTLHLTSVLIVAPRYQVLELCCHSWCRV